MAAENSLSIGVLSKATGVTVETIRWYERVALLPAAARTAGNYRVYKRVHLERLSFVRRARDLGFSLVQVRELLQLADVDRSELQDLRRSDLPAASRDRVEMILMSADGWSCRFCL